MNKRLGRWRIRGISFDLDDTLWAIAPVIHQAEATAWRWLTEHCPRITNHFDIDSLRELRNEVARERPELGHDFTALRRHALEIALKRCGYDAEIAEQALAAFLQARNEVTLFPDVVPTLVALHQRFRLVVLTNGNADIHHIGLGTYFIEALHARHVGALKPDPAMFRAAGERLGLRPEEVLHVGDHPVDDVYGAAQAGMRTAWVNRDGLQWQHDHAPDIELRTLTGLIHNDPA